MKFKLAKVSLILGLFFSFNANAGVLDLVNPTKSLKTKIVVGAVGYMAMQSTADYFLKNPEKLSQFLETHPEKIEPLKQYVDKKIAKAKTQEEEERYLNFKEQLNLGYSENRILTLEDDFEWQSIKQEVDGGVLTIDSVLVQNNKMPTNCSVANLQVLLLPHKQFEASINQSLPTIQSTPTEILNVNTYQGLASNYRGKTAVIKQNQDHIPSYAAIEQFLINHGVNVKYYGIPGKRDPDLAKNETAISLPEEIHKLGRTYVGRNSQSQIQRDAADLLEATKKDITTTAYAFLKNPQYNINYRDYIEAGLVLYARNKMLCLYDVR